MGTCANTPTQPALSTRLHVLPPSPLPALPCSPPASGSRTTYLSISNPPGSRAPAPPSTPGRWQGPRSLRQPVGAGPSHPDILSSTPSVCWGADRFQATRTTGLALGRWSCGSFPWPVQHRATRCGASLSQTVFRFWWPEVHHPPLRVEVDMRAEPAPPKLLGDTRSPGLPSSGRVLLAVLGSLPSPTVKGTSLHVSHCTSGTRPPSLLRPITLCPA